MREKNRAPAQNRPSVDAVVDNWVDLSAPLWTQPFLRLSRLDRPIGAWLLLIPCWWGLLLAIGADGNWSWNDAWIAVACAIGAVLMRGAGCTWNDITDRKIDAQVARTRTRPLPSGQIGVFGAVVWMILQLAGAAWILSTFNDFAIMLGVAALIPVVIYPFAKRFTWWPQVFLGIAFNWGAMLGWAAHTGSLSLAPLVLYAAGIAWTMFYDTIYAHQDVEDDALIGVKSTALKFGESSPTWLLVFAMLCGMIMLTAVTIVSVETASLLGVSIFVMHLLWQWMRLTPSDPAHCLMLFRSNRNAGLILTAFLLWAALS